MSSAQRSMLISSWALLTMEEKIISVEEKIIWEGLKKKKKKSVLSVLSVPVIILPQFHSENKEQS